MRYAKQIAGLLIGLSGMVGVAIAANDAGMIKKLTGKVTVERNDQVIAAKMGDTLQQGDKITTAKNSSVGITMRDGSMLSSGAESVIVLDKFVFNSTTHAGAMETSLKRGTLGVISGKIAKTSPETVKFRTQYTTLGVRGTEFIIETTND